MKNIITLLLLLLVANQATSQNQKIILTKNKVTQLIFPDKIKKYRGGFSPAMFALDQYENILYIQCLVEFEESNLSVITEDNSNYIFDIVYAPATTQNAYVIDANDKIIVNRVLESTPSSDSQVTTQYKDSLSNPTKDAIISKILSEKGYIVSNNGVKAKNMEVFLKGIYINQQDIYFRIELTNTSNIPYTYNYIGFNMTSRKKGRVSSVEREDYEPPLRYTVIISLLAAVLFSSVTNL